MSKNDNNTNMVLEKKMERPNEIFYKYRIGEFNVWFTRSKPVGNINAIYVDSDDFDLTRFKLYTRDNNSNEICISGEL